MNKITLFFVFTSVFVLSVSLSAKSVDNSSATSQVDSVVTQMSTKVSMEIDTLLFPKVELGTVFLSEKSACNDNAHGA
jgi:hypothetical protein